MKKLFFTKRLPSAKNFIFENKINKVLRQYTKKHLGIITVGVATTETIDALDLIGVFEPQKHGIGIFACKVPWPLN